MINSIYLVFNSGRSGVTDLEQMVFNDGRPTFSRLREKEDFKDFKDFKVEHSTLVWSEELDLAAEYLFYVTFMDEPDLQEKFDVNDDCRSHMRHLFLPVWMTKKKKQRQKHLPITNRVLIT